MKKSSSLYCSYNVWVMAKLEDMEDMTEMKTIKLNNGVEMPVLGYGVFLVNSEECERCVLDAIEVGYRLIDTAQAYYNEDGVGRAIEKCGVPRNELFITTKVWISNAGEEKAFRSIGESLQFVVGAGRHPQERERTDALPPSGCKESGYY